MSYSFFLFDTMPIRFDEVSWNFVYKLHSKNLLNCKEPLNLEISFQMPLLEWTKTVYLLWRNWSAIYKAQVKMEYFTDFD